MNKPFRFGHERCLWGLLLIAALFFARENHAGGQSSPGPGSSKGSKHSTVVQSGMLIRSEAFGPRGEIPQKFTCEGTNVSPPVSWEGIPASAKSLVLIVDDPDAPDPKAPKMTWVHWVVFNIPPTIRGLPEGVTKLPDGAREGISDFKKKSYGGPCPPIGRHRYFHKLYALDTVLELDQPNKADLERAMQSHILAKAELIGTYQKSGKK